MNFEEVKTKLISEGYENNPVTVNTVNRLLSLTGRPYDMFQEWMTKGVIPSFEPIHGVGSEFLINKLSMKAPALVIAYAMLEENPEENAEYFKKLADNLIGFYIE